VKMTPEQHKLAHIELHRKLDELIGDWIYHTKSLPDNCSVLALLAWSYSQTQNPTETNK